MLTASSGPTVSDQYGPEVTRCLQAEWDELGDKRDNGTMSLILVQTLEQVHSLYVFFLVCVFIVCVILVCVRCIYVFFSPRMCEWTSGLVR